MMAHLSGQRAAYAISTSWREKDPGRRRLLRGDYDRFCREVGGSFLELVRYWYHNDPNARRWWRQAKTLMGCAYGSSRPQVDFPRIVDLYMEGKIKLNELITRRFNRHDIE